MGELVLNSAVEMELPVEKHNCVNRTAGGGVSGATAPGTDASIVNWERFLPKMVRVMLVEADDSTRQIIAALLRKCSYRVAAVPDGLKAWELLKGRPRSIDLILTEVELPSISGYTLLSLIMEHEPCKNIPVIMMSSYDSVSTVYKCMLRGAADFLVKPVRKNELRNLWQHVWRKQASSTGADLGPPDESVAQEKDEATAENNAVSNHSSSHMSSAQRNQLCIEKGSDDQSSCTKPKSETEGEAEHDHSISLLKTGKCLPDGNRISSREECHQERLRKRARDDEDGESRLVESHQIRWESVDRINKNNDVHENSSKEAIDLIGALDNHQKGAAGNSASDGVVNKLHALPSLDLSLRRSLSLNQAAYERPLLNHSDASPFSKYVNKSPQPHHSALPSSCSEHKDNETNSEKISSSHILELNSEMCCRKTGSQKQVSVATVQPHHENTFAYSQDREICHPIPVRGVRLHNSIMPSIYSTKSGSPGLPSPGTSHYSESLSQLNNTFNLADSQPSASPRFHSFVGQRISESIDHMESKHGEKVEDHSHVSPGNDGSTNSSYCNGNMSHHQSAGSGSNGKIEAISIVKAPEECGNEESLPIHEGSFRRSIQREAALTKFRLKRKDRCFEKKVRYESRKKLAEQRPRVKGQFVRQVPNEPQPGNASAG